MQINRKYIPLLLGIAVAIGIGLGNQLNFADAPDRFFVSNSKKDKLNRLIDYIDYEYVDEINTDSIVDVTVNGILNTLDPHSVYIPKEDLEAVTQSMDGGFVGIGINFRTTNDTITVIKPTENGPSDLVGIKAGDRLLKANETIIYGDTLTTDFVTSQLKGEKGTSLNLTVYRKQTDSIFTVTLKRDFIPLKSVVASYMLTDSLGYIKLNRFAQSTYVEFTNALQTLIQRGAQQLVLDVRNNPGGFLGIAEQIADEFLKDETLILFTKDKKGRIKEIYATENGRFENGNVYVLINENSASASEVIAGALQDNDIGTIIGRRSYGKGLVQREMALGDGSAIRLTVSRYYTPTGRSIQKPYKNGESTSYYNDYYKRILNGELTNEEEIKVNDSLKFTTPKGKIVYGGGGIIPDVFIPQNSNPKRKVINYLNNRGYFDRFVFNMLDENRLLFNNITKKEFINTFEVSEKTLLKFYKFVNTEERSLIAFNNYETQVKQYLKAHIAAQVFNDDMYQAVINKTDSMVIKAIDLSRTTLNNH